MGKRKYEKDTPLDIRWTNEKIKVLGFNFGNTDVSKDNWEPTIGHFLFFFKYLVQTKINFTWETNCIKFIGYQCNRVFI